MSVEYHIYQKSNICEHRIDKNTITSNFKGPKYAKNGWTYL
jgi:hypothetical protein